MKSKLHLNPVSFGILCLANICALPLQSQTSPGEPIGQFEGHGDVGTVLHAGSASFDNANGTYAINGSGENMWAAADAFQFVWKKMSGDISISADISFPTHTGNPHKKAVLMIRQSLDADSPYVDVALHVAGLTSIQSRPEKGGPTHEVGIENEGAVKLRLEKRGDWFYMFVAKTGEPLHFSGGSLRLALQEPFYVGLGVCAHDKDAIESANFTNVAIGAPAPGKTKLYSTLETVSLSSTDRRIVAVYPSRIATATYSADGANIVFENGKRWEQIPIAGGQAQPLGSVPPRLRQKASDRLSPDKTRSAALSNQNTKPGETELTVKTLADGQTKKVADFLGRNGTLSATPWSPDGKRLVFVSYEMLPAE